MKVLLIVLMASCSFQSAGVPDGREVQIALDATEWRRPDSTAPDAIPAERQCGMGLPDSREQSLDDGDPIAHGTINKIQDGQIGNWRKPWTRTFYPQLIGQTTPGLVVAGVTTVPLTGTPSLNFTAAGTASFAIPFDDGDQILGFDIDVLGNGVATMNASPIVYQPHANDPSGGGDPANGGNVVIGGLAGHVALTGAAWTNIVAGPFSGVGFFPAVLVSGAVLYFQVTSTATGICLSRARAQFVRRP